MPSQLLKHSFNAPLIVMALALSATQAHAATFKFSDDSDLVFTFDTIFSVGALVRTEHPDKRNVGIVNGGTSRSVNEDQGNLNYERGEVVSLALKGLHDLDISSGKTGFFARFGYVSDLAARRKDELSEIAHKRMDFDMELFDAFLRHEFDVSGQKINVRLGSQVVSWGESTFILGGINAINPIDVVRFRTPGSELKEAFIPVPMFFASTQVTDDITLEAFYQFKFKPFQIDPSGAFFSTTDVFGPGGQTAYTGFGRTPDAETKDRESRTCGSDCEPPEASEINRGPDRLARDDGQYGLAMRWFTPFFGNAEIGLYAMNYHSRIPLGSATKGAFLNNPTLGDQAVVFAEYPEDIQLYGISFNAPGPFGLALQGEYSYRPNLPLQKASVELSLAALGVPNQAGFGNDLEGGASNPAPGAYLQGFERVPFHQFQFTALKAIPNLFGASQVIGLFEAAFVHMQLPDGILFNGPGVYLPGEQSGNTGTAALFNYPSPLVANGSAQPRGVGYATRNSWGYRAVTRFEYNNVFAGVNMLPRLVFSHDVKGVSPFLTEDVKAISVGVQATYNQVWSADVAYTTFFGGREIAGTDCQSDLSTPIIPILLPGTGSAACGAPGPTNLPEGQSPEFRSIANPNIDRDFVAASLSYAF